MNSAVQYSVLSLLHCPVCNEKLARNATGFCCVNGHSFDRAKEGYINLLLSHQRKSSHPGDDARMIQARRRFFDSGVFAPVSQAVRQIILTREYDVNGAMPLHILDCGCGEGYFLGALDGMRFGVDISKDAVRCAAKRYKDVNWMVANAMRTLPFADQAMDVILSILAPRNLSEFARILTSDGMLVFGVPGPNHLIELRSLLTDQADDYEEKADEAVAKCAPQFSEIRRDLLRYEVVLSQEQICDLIQMTPIFWCSDPERKADVQQLSQLPLTISLVLITLVKRVV